MYINFQTQNFSFSPVNENVKENSLQFFSKTETKTKINFYFQHKN